MGFQCAAGMGMRFWWKWIQERRKVRDSRGRRIHPGDSLEDYALKGQRSGERRFTQRVKESILLCFVTREILNPACMDGLDPEEGRHHMSKAYNGKMGTQRMCARTAQMLRRLN